MIDPCLIQGVQIDHAQLDVVRSFLGKSSLRIGSRRLYPHRKIQLRRRPYQLIFNDKIDTFRIRIQVRVIQDRCKKIPVSDIGATAGCHPVIHILPTVALLKIRAVQQGTGGRYGNHQPVVDLGRCRKRHIEIIFIFLVICLSGQFKIRFQQIFVKRIIKVDPGEGHLVPAVAHGQILPVLGLGIVPSLEPGDGYILFI